MDISLVNGHNAREIVIGVSVALSGILAGVYLCSLRTALPHFEWEKRNAHMFI